MWSQWTEKAKKALEETTEALSAAERRASESVTNALERTGEVITQAATKNTTPSSKKTVDEAAFDQAIDSAEKELAESNTTADTLNSSHLPQIPAIDKVKMMNLWSTVVESTIQAAEATKMATKEAIDATKEVVETSRTNIERQFLKKGFYKRDPRLPLDAEALRDAEVVYITDRIITMSHPATPSKSNPSITAERKLAAVGHLLHRRHDGRFLVWNLSEVEYDISVLDDQVLTFSFPGSPSPPLGLLLKLLVSMENWMKADERNVAVVHCLTGKGRSSTVLAAFLSWMGEAGFGDVNEALAYIAKCKQMKPEDLTIPSQRRYAQYMNNMMDGVRPSQPPLMLKRIIMSEAPRFAKGPTRDVQVDKDDGKAPDEEQLMGCAPYLQIFKAGKLIFTSAATLHVQQSEEELPFVQVMDGTVPFNIGEIIQGDILIRCRHLTFNKKRVSMFRAAFHTGYVPPNVLRITKSQLDGACDDRRYPDSFFLDLIFEKVDAETVAKHLKEYGGEEETDPDKELAGKKGKGGAVVKASKFDSMLQGDSRFWDVINQKKQEHLKQASDDPFWGPTVGRRRGGGTNKEDSEQKDQGAQTKERTHMETFSIGHELDFLPTEEESAPVRDSLMDALNALDEDDAAHHEADTEEIVFGSVASNSSEPVFVEDESTPASESTGTGQASAIQTNPEILTVGTKGESKGADASNGQTAEKSASDDIDDMDALLASADEDFGDLDLDGFDDDDDELEDLESMLKT
ncbi:C2 domain containing protein [Nitzschia inconspicua]|uniref:C2 domain containing protein n=1 Tax=Nitzschia inconspicua TaxID=303405 RepID=A0A9K3QA73_9STRA|nr:C2 domain containing protein [Nitzschia inconspicua]